MQINFRLYRGCYDDERGYVLPIKKVHVNSKYMCGCVCVWGREGTWRMAAAICFSKYVTARDCHKIQ